MLRFLDNSGLLHRVYSQNIDGLEAKVGFDIFSTKGSQKCILLHGSITNIQCEKCLGLYMLENYLPLLQVGDPIDCPACLDKSRQPAAASKRPMKPGRLHPKILLFNQPSPTEDKLAHITLDDIKSIQSNHVLLIAGTSLQIPGVKSILNSLIKAMVQSKSTNCTIIYLDTASKIPSVLPKEILHVKMDCQEFSALTIKKIKTPVTFNYATFPAARRDFRPLWDWS